MKHSARPTGRGWLTVGLTLSAIVLLSLLDHPASAAGWKAGAAKVAITPCASMWMSGYGGRTKPAEGQLTDLWAKALVLEDPQGKRAALVTLDLVGIDRQTSQTIRQQLDEKFALPLEQTAICTSHTHTGPVVGHNLGAMYFLTDQQWRQVRDYTTRLEGDVVDVVGQALKRLEPCELSWGGGQATFAVNRRENRGDIDKLRAEGQLKGPVDHAVPVLKVAGRDGKLLAVAFGYACHATVLSFYEWSGDYPGFAQIELEKSHPGAIALFWAGCGADQNPLPRRTVELAQEYGARLAKSVEKTLASEMKPIGGNLSTAYQEIDLPLAELPSREQIEKDTKSTNRYVARRAQLLLERLDRDGRLAASYPYPVQTWRLGSGPLWVTLGGEVVVDYALRLKRELGANIWIAGYTNDVMAYIPSRRVLLEGGYEGGGAMVYYGLPTVWAMEVEEIIDRAVRKQADTVGWRAN